MTELTFTECPALAPPLDPRQAEKTFTDLTGQGIGRLYVEGLSARRVSKTSIAKGRQWVCRCGCGVYIIRRTAALRSGKAQPCDQCKGAGR